MPNLKIGVVGPCSAGKSTLIGALTRQDIRAHHIAQEHSKVPDMWKRLDEPDVLIYLDVSYRVSMQRRPLNMSSDEFAEQVYRLQHAREHADLYIHTDELSPEEVFERVRGYLEACQGEA
jgi:cytidylate kinase